MSTRMSKRPFIPDDVLRLKMLSDPRISPDGRWIAYVETYAETKKDEFRSRIRLVPTTPNPGDASEPVRFTNGPKKDSQPRWSPDGRLLAFVRELPEDKPQLYLIRASGGEAWPLTDMPKGAGTPAWSPDGRRICFEAGVGGEKDSEEKSEVEKHAPRVVDHLIYKLDGVGHFDGRRTHLFVVDIVDADAALPEPRQITDGDWDDRSPAWSPDGGSLVFTSYREPDRHEVGLRVGDLWIVSAQGGEPRKLTRSSGPALLPAWSPDGRWIAFVGHEHRESFSGRTTHLRVVPAAGGEIRTLSQPLDRSLPTPPFAPFAHPTWTPDSRALHFLAIDRGNTSLFRADLDGDVRQVVGGERTLIGWSFTRDASQIAFVATDPNRPPDLYLADGEGREERQLTNANRELLEELQLGITERIHYAGADGWDVEGWVVKPVGFVEGRRHPAVLEVHGGPHSHYGSLFSPVFHSLAGAGYLVVYLNPRGSSGYGEPFCMACTADWGGKDFEDLMRGLDYVVANGWADPDRLGVTGYSYGGFMTLWAVGHTDRFKAAVSGAPVGDNYSMWGTSDVGPQFLQHEMGGKLPQEDPDAYLAHSPVHHLTRCTTPTLLLHHEGDLRCPIGQAEEAFAVLKKAGVETQMVRYPGGFHTYATHAPSQRVDALRRTNAWIDRFLAVPAREPTAVSP